MAPEQARAEFALDARADLFALGAILWELLTGKRLWEGLSEVDVLARLADDTPLPAARSIVPMLTEPIDALCSLALAKVRDERVDSAADFLAAMESATAKPGMRASTEEVGAFVTSLFADERAKMRAVVAEARAKPAAEDYALPLGPSRAPNASPLVDAESDPLLRFGTATREEAPAKRIVEVIEIAAPPPPDRRFVYVMAAAALVVVAVAVTLTLASPKEEKKTESTPTSHPPRPAPPVPAPSASAYTEPAEVTIEHPGHAA